jgi:phage tail sheath protein FI
VPEYLAPGVYVEEMPRGPRTIEGVSTSTTAFLGETERGPTWPRLVTGYGEYTRIFGENLPPDKFMPYAVHGFFENGGRRLVVCRVVGAGAVHANRTFGSATLYAIGAGKWGNHLYARIDASTQRTADGEPTGFRVRVAYWAGQPDSFQPFDVFDVPGAGPAPTAVESHDALSIDPASPDFYERRLALSAATGSALVYLDFGGVTPPELPAFERGAPSGGANGQPVVASDFIGAEGVDGRVAAQGLNALQADAFDDVALIHAPHPGADVDAVHHAIVTHCEGNRFRFAVLDCNRGTSPLISLNPREQAQLDSPFAAFYCPWLQMADPHSGAPTLVPPGGYVAGIYVRTDMEKGVHVAPANQVVRGALDVEVAMRESDQEILNPRGVNAIRRFEGRGIFVWGGRTLSADPEWKYVNVRRLFIYLERSIEEGLQWVVCEPNGEALWARVTDAVRLFLHSQWISGALQGRTENEAFFVRCDRTTMTQDDVLSGRLVCEVGIALLKPAEFVMIRIEMRTGVTP